MIVASAIGLTRIYLRAHYLSDVVAGWGLGATIFALCGIVALVVAFLRHNGRAAREQPSRSPISSARCGVFGSRPTSAFILVPAWTAYSRVWERVAAAFLSLYVLAAFIGLGAPAVAPLVWFWDRIGADAAPGPSSARPARFGRYDCLRCPLRLRGRRPGSTSRPWMRHRRRRVRRGAARGHPCGRARARREPRADRPRRARCSPSPRGRRPTSASLLGDADGVEILELRVADEQVGQLRLRVALRRRAVADGAAAGHARWSPPRSSACARRPAPRSRPSRELRRTTCSAGGSPTRERGARPCAAIGLDVGDGALGARRPRPAARARPRRAGATRVVTVAERGARAAVPAARRASPGAPKRRAAEVVVLLPGGDEAAAERVAEAVLRELDASLPGHTFALGRSRVAHRPGGAAARRQRGAAGRQRRRGRHDVRTARVLAFDDTGAYRLLLSAMSEDPAELQRFYAETIEPLVAYDEQYETDLVVTVEAFLDADGNVAGTAQRLFTHRHTIRYRLERVRELSGLDVGSTDGREKLSLGLKAMRVLGHRGPRRSGERAGRGRRARPAPWMTRFREPLASGNAPSIGTRSPGQIRLVTGVGRISD